MKNIEINKLIKHSLILKLLLIYIFLFSLHPFSAKPNSEINDLETEENIQKKSITIKEYSTGTVFKEIAPTTPNPIIQKSLSSTNEDDPGFPGDPGQLPVGDGFIILLVTGIFYFLYRKNLIKKNHE